MNQLIINWLTIINLIIILKLSFFHTKGPCSVCGDHLCGGFAIISGKWREATLTYYKDGRGRGRMGGGKKGKKEGQGGNKFKKKG